MLNTFGKVVANYWLGQCLPRRLRPGPPQHPPPVRDDGEVRAAALPELHQLRPRPRQIRSICCRLRLDLRELLARGNGLFGSAELTGSIGVVTVNCARLGYFHAGDDAALLAELDALLKLGAQVLEARRTASRARIAAAMPGRLEVHTAVWPDSPEVAGLPGGAPRCSRNFKRCTAHLGHSEGSPRRHLPHFAAAADAWARRSGRSHVAARRGCA